jgi:hypothetical protein
MPDEVAPEAVEVDDHALAAMIAQDAVAEVTRLQRDVLRALFPATDSGLMRHAEREMAMAGVGDPDSDYDGWAKDCVLDLMRVFSSQGHSEGSAFLILDLFSILAHYKTLSPLTSDPDEWMDVFDGAGMELSVWQNRRRSDAFSNDGGQTWYYLDEPQRTQADDPRQVMHRPGEYSIDHGETWFPEVGTAAQTNG